MKADDGKREGAEQDQKTWLTRWFPRIEKKYLVLAIAIVVLLYFVIGRASS